MRGTRPAGRVVAAPARSSPLDALACVVVLLTATGFRFLGEAHVREPTLGEATLGVADVAIALQVALVPLLLAVMLMAARGQGWGELGLTRAPGATGWAAALAAAAALLALRNPEPSGPGLIMVAGAGGILAEELLRRGFLLNELTTVLGGGRRARLGALAVLAATAMIGHAPLGAAAAVAAGAADLALGVAYLAGRGSLWTTVAARALVLAVLSLPG